MKIALGGDHRGFSLKQFIIEYLSKNHTVIDVGCYNFDRCDFPQYAQAVAEKIQKKEAKKGILLCGSGIGMSIAANRHKDIYASLVWNEEIALSSRKHNNANVLVLPADFISEEKIIEILDIWLSTEFLGGTYLDRINLIDE